MSKMYMKGPGCTKDAGSRQQRSKPASCFGGQDMAAAVILGRSTYVLFDKRNDITYTKGKVKWTDSGRFSGAWPLTS